MQLVRATTSAELPSFFPLRVQPFVLRREVVPIFAIGALQYHFFARHRSLLVDFGYDASTYGATAFAYRKTKTLFHRDWRD